MLMNFSNSPEKKVEAEKEYVPVGLRAKSTVPDKKVEKDPLDDDYEGLEHGIEMEFEIKPQQKYDIFAKYMFNKYLTIDIWDGESLMHFGSCKFPLNLLML